jgi:hypothetical protein
MRPVIVPCATQGPYGMVNLDNNGNSRTVESSQHIEDKQDYSEPLSAGNSHSGQSGIDNDCNPDIPYNIVLSKSARRIRKRKTTPIESQPKKQSLHLLSASTRMIGIRSSSNLRAADPRQPTEKTVFCLSNLSLNCSVDDIKSHCKSIKVRVLFCFDISNGQYSSKAFKLAVPTTDASIVYDVESWPQLVSIRPWNSSATALPRFTSSPHRIGSVHSDSAVHPFASFVPPSNVIGSEGANPVTSGAGPPSDSLGAVPSDALNGAVSMADDDVNLSNEETILTQPLNSTVIQVGCSESSKPSTPTCDG